LIPYAMLGAIPPRRTVSVSTRNDSDTLCSWSATNCSVNRPGKCIRWSVAMEPVTTIFMTTLRGRGLRPVPELTGQPASPPGERAGCNWGKRAARGRCRWWSGISLGPAHLERVRGGGTDILLAPHPAPGGNVVGRGRVVGQHPHHRPDRHLRQAARQRDHRHRAALPPAVQYLHCAGHIPTSARRSATTPGRTVRNRSTCSSVV